MQSKISFFNRTLFLENLRRFWPLWAVYAAVWLIAEPVLCFVRAFGRNVPLTKAELILDLRNLLLRAGSDVGLMVALIFGILFAIALFAYLMNSRAVGMFHSFPIRREGLFLTNYLSGVIIFTAAQILAVILTVLVQLAAGAPDFPTLGTAFLCSWGQMLFFYSFGVFCAVFTGQILAIPVFYGVLNVLVYGLCAMTQALAESVYFGFRAVVPGWVEWLNPVVKLENSISITPVFNETAGVVTEWTFEGLHVVLIYVLVGLILIIPAFVLYRYRASETAGDTIAVPWAKPIFLYGVAICFALTLGQGLYYLVWDELFQPEMLNFPVMAVCMILLGLVGYWGAEMLLKKSFHVFRDSWKNAVGLAVILIVLLLGVRVDILGVERYVPELDSIESISYYMKNCSGDLEDPAEIAKFLEAHQAILAEKDSLRRSNSYDETYSYGNLDLHYYLKNGQTIRREYSFRYQESDIDQAGSAMNLLAKLGTEPAVQRANLFNQRQLPERFTGGELEQVSLSGERTMPISLDAKEAQALYNALLRDIDARHVGQNLFRDSVWDKETYYNDLTLYYIVSNQSNQSYEATRPSGPKDELYRSSSVTLQFSVHCTELLNELDRLGIREKVQLMTNKEWNDYWDEQEKQTSQEERVWDEQSAIVDLQ